MKEREEGAILAWLSHHGIKGQRWGVRRTKAALARAAQREGRRLSPEAERAKQLRKKKRKELTNEELKFLNDRLNLEKNSSNLNPHAIEQGKRKTAAVIGTIGLAVTLVNYANSPAGKFAIATGKKVVANQLAKPLFGALPINVP